MSAKPKPKARTQRRPTPPKEERRVLVVYFFENWCFVRHPADAALWLRVPSVVGLTPCGACGAKLGEPCRGQNGVWTRSVHVDRKLSYAGRRARSAAR